jgi:hypothetical protein
MYPLLCAGRYPVPEKEGVMEICAVSVSPLVVGQEMNVQLRDDVGNDSADYLTDPDKNRIIHLQGNGDTPIQVVFEPALKARKGLVATHLTNAVCHVYVR